SYIVAFSRVGGIIVFSCLSLHDALPISWLAAANGSVFNEQGLVSYLIWPMIILLGGIILARRAGNQTLVFVPVILWLVADTLSADRKSTRLNSSHVKISYAVFCLKKKKL